MTTAVRLRHTNRTGLHHLSATGAWRDGDAPPFSHPERPRPAARRQRHVRIPVAPAVAATARPQERRRRHDLLPVGPGLALCTACGCVFELHAYVDSGRRLPFCT